MTGWPRLACASCARDRICKSAVEPAVHGMTRRIGRAGNPSWAQAGAIDLASIGEAMAAPSNRSFLSRNRQFCNMQVRFAHSLLPRIWRLHAVVVETDLFLSA